MQRWSKIAVAYALSNVQDDKDSTIKANAKSSADMTVLKQETTKEFELVRKELLAIKKSSDEVFDLSVIKNCDNNINAIL